MISFPSGTEMFHFPELAPGRLCVRRRVPGHCSRRVSPFRDSRIIGRLAPPRDLSQLAASFVAHRRQGIRPALFLTCSTLPSLPCSIVKPAPTPAPGLRPGRAPYGLGLAFKRRLWWSWPGLNRRPPACKAGALPVELQPRAWWAWIDLNYRPRAYQARALTA